MQQLGRSLRAFVFLGGWALALGMASCGGGGGGGGGAALPFAAVGTAAPPSEPPPAPATPPAPPPPTETPVAPPPTDEPAEPPAPASRVATDTITSAKTGATYPLDIYLPASYDGSSKSYPVIYALDGDGIFNPPGTRFSNLKDILESRQTQAILVGIGGTARREQDYVLPGATAYHDFLTQELVPFIESKYRADPKMRMLTGLSLSGSMAGIALFLEGAANNLTFSYFLSFEGAYAYQGPEYENLEQQMHDSLNGRPLPATLILTRCSDPVECNGEPVESMYKRLVGRGYQGLAVEEATYSTTHTETDIPSFADAIARLLP